MAIEAIVRRSMAGKVPASGARPATQDLELEDYEAIFKTKTIYTGQRERNENTKNEFLYQRLLGDAWNGLPEPIKHMHQSAHAEGLATVVVGNNPLARLTAKLMGFPTPGKDIPVQVSFQKDKNGELWTRTFAEKSFSSFQSEGQGLSERLLAEQFGLMKFSLALVVEKEKLSLIMQRWSFLGIPLPLFLAPKGETFEYVENGRFNFHVEIKLPLIGLIIKYQGWLIPKE